MEELKCYISEVGPSRHNWVLYFGYLTVFPVYFVATILAYFDTELAIGVSGVVLHFSIIFVSEWLIRNFLIKQRPGFVCIEDNKLILWYLAGMVRIEYPQSQYQVLPLNEGECLRLKIKKRFLPLSIKMKDYLLIYEHPPTFDLLKIRLRDT